MLRHMLCLIYICEICDQGESPATNQVVQLQGGSKARLMCDKHPAGPLDVPDPAKYKDTKVRPCY